MRLVVVGAMMAIAMPAAGGQFMKFDGVKGETGGRAACADIITGAGRGGGAFKQAKLTPRKGGSDGEAINGGLNRDIIRRIPKSPARAEARGGVQVAAGDLNGDGRADGKRTKVGDITLKRGVAGGC